MNFARFILLTLAACFAIGCAHSSSTLAEKPSIPTTESGCKEMGGNWGPLGISGTLRCDVKTTDAGRTCKDSRECQGSCVAPDGTAAGARITGSCSAYVANFGNVIFVTDGVADPYDVE